MVLKVLSLDQLLSASLENLLDMQILRPSPELLNPKFWGWGPAFSIPISRPGDSGARWSLRNTGLRKWQWMAQCLWGWSLRGRCYTQLCEREWQLSETLILLSLPEIPSCLKTLPTVVSMTCIYIYIFFSCSFLSINILSMDSVNRDLAVNFDLASHQLCNLRQSPYIP